MKSTKHIFLCLLITLNVYGQVQQNGEIHPDDYPGLDNSFLCGPIPPVCQPTCLNVSGPLWIGIRSFQFNQDTFSVAPASGPFGYYDFDCVDSIIVNAGNSYSINIMTGQTYGESVRIWIDYNNDGYFIPSEIIFEDSAILYNHIGFAYINLPLAVNVPLRMRVMSEVEGFPMPDGCSNVNYGHCYDYTGYVLPPTEVEEEFMETGLTLFPNPAGEIFNVSDPENQIQSVEVFNLTGQRIQVGTKTRKHYSMEMETPGLPGLYFVKVETEKGLAIHKLIVQ